MIFTDSTPHKKGGGLNKCEGHLGVILESCLSQCTKIEGSQGRVSVVETGMWV